MTVSAALDAARALQDAGEQRAAIRAWHDALVEGAPPAEVHLQLGVLHAELCEHHLAVQHLEKALTFAPQDPDVLCMLGSVMHELGRFEDAARYCAQSIDANPGHSQAHFNLGLAQFERSDIAGALAHIARGFALRRGEPWSDDPAGRLLRDPRPEFTDEELAISAVKARHDSEQLDHLLSLGRLPQGYRPVMEQYRALLAELPQVIGATYLFDARRFPLVARTLKRPLYVAAESDVPGPVVNPQVDWAAMEDAYLKARPGMATVDGILAPDALRELRAFCRESTIWNAIKSGYLGAYFYDGFSSPLLLRLASELRMRMPRVIRGLPLRMMWGYKYDSEIPGSGIALHADGAAVNVNFWITENEANLAPDRGGLLVHTVDTPRDWGFAKYNLDSVALQARLEAARSVPVRVPYRANRAVIFDSGLIHATDSPHFRAGYLNRRINVTLLYGSAS